MRIYSSFGRAKGNRVCLADYDYMNDFQSGAENSKNGICFKKHERK